MTSSRLSRRRDAEANRAGILDAALRLLARDPSASIDAIAGAAGLSRRALYGHFPDRAELLAAVIAQGAEHVNRLARDLAARDEDDPILALADLAAALWDEAVRVHALAVIALDEQHIGASAEALAPLRDRLLTLCRAAHDCGRIRADLPPEVTARLVEEVVRGTVLRIDPEEATRYELAPRAVLSVIGLGWSEVDAVLARRAAAGESGESGEAAA